MFSDRSGGRSPQRDRSRVSFDVRVTYAYDGDTNKFDSARRRQADVYVFALLKHEEKMTLDPLDLTQWEFMCLEQLFWTIGSPLKSELVLGR
jgi:hypothetical protein